MKPIIIYQKEVEDDKVILTKEEFEKCIQDVYDSGYSDGSNSFTAKGYTWTPNSLTSPEKPYSVYYTSGSGKAPEIPCSISTADNRKHSRETVITNLN